MQQSESRFYLPCQVKRWRWFRPWSLGRFWAIYQSFHWVFSFLFQTVLWSQDLSSWTCIKLQQTPWTVYWDWVCQQWWGCDAYSREVTVMVLCTSHSPSWPSVWVARMKLWVRFPVEVTISGARWYICVLPVLIRFQICHHTSLSDLQDTEHMYDQYQDHSGIDNRESAS